jgi:Flp pilus assembly pilin Flp
MKATSVREDRRAAGPISLAVWNGMSRLLADDRGQDLAEYGIALAVIGAAAIAAAAAIGVNVNALWTTIQPRIAMVAGAV